MLLAGLQPGLAADEGWAGRYSLREWHVQDGLPSEDLTGVHQDRAGYLWVATSGGLTRFDGVHFEDFGPELKRAGASSYVRVMTETAGKGLIVAPSSGGTMALQGGVFRPLPFAEGRIVNALFAEPDGTLWASCDDRTVLRWQAGKTDEFRPNEGGRYRLVAHFAMDGPGRTWIAGATMIGRHEAGRIEPLNSEFGGSEFRVASSRSDGVWVLTTDRLLKTGAGGLQVILQNLPTMVGAHFVTDMHEDRNGILWIGTRSQGLYAVAGGQLHPVPTSGEAVTGICEDTEGGIWVACNGGGLNRLRLRDIKIYDRSAGLSDNFSYTVSEDSEGAVWFGNRDGGVARLRDGKIETFYRGSGPGLSVASVVPDGKGKAWVTGGAGVFKVDPAGGGTVELVEGMPTWPASGVAFVARNGDYWFGLYPDRVGRYRDGKLDTFGAAQGYDGKFVLAITEDREGNILVGTREGKLRRFEGGRFNPMAAGVPEDPDAPIYDIYCEPDTGLTWITTGGQGLHVLGGGRLRQILPEDGLIDSNITTILPDDQGSLWFGSGKGIFSVRRQELAELLDGRISRVHPLVVGRDDGEHGLTCIGFNKPSAWKARDGHLWFATRKGVVNFDPARAIVDTACPPAFVAAVKCDDAPRTLDHGTLGISARVRKLELRFSVLCLSTPERVQIKHRLEGFDSQWITTAPDRIVTYPQLPPGRYRLRTMSSLGNGAWNETPSALVLTVIPLWWQTSWFQFAAASGLVALVVVIVRLVSHRRLRSRLDLLERESAVERERVRIARNIHDDLGASLTRISLLTQSATRNAETSEGSQLAQIYETVSQITRSMDEIVWAVNPKNDHLNGLVTYLVGYAQSFLAVAGIRCRLDLPDQLPVAPLTSQVRHNLYLCLKEALNNVVKHSGAGEVTIALQVNPAAFTLTISDNGQTQAAGSANGTEGHAALRVMPGQGLANIAQRVAEMGGIHEFAPAAGGQGARVSITLALQTPSTLRRPETVSTPSIP